jgi:hypothetical protein
MDKKKQRSRGERTHPKMLSLAKSADAMLCWIDRARGWEQVGCRKDRREEEKESVSVLVRSMYEQERHSWFERRNTARFVVLLLPAFLSLEPRGRCQVQWSPRQDPDNPTESESMKRYAACVPLAIRSRQYLRL